jgi:hypothetical protein
VVEINELLDILPPSSSVSVTSPENLMRKKCVLFLWCGVVVCVLVCSVACSGCMSVDGQFLCTTNPHMQCVLLSPGELFTHKGCGTLCRKETKINVYEDMSNIDISRLKSLLKKSFHGRPPVEGYLENLDSNIHRIYLADNYEGKLARLNCGMGGCLVVPSSWCCG